MSNKWKETAVIYDEDALENFLSSIKEKIYKEWKNNKVADAEITLDFFEDE